MTDGNDQNRPTPPSNSSSRGGRQWPDDENPFVAFRRFADEQISSMLQSVMGLPSMITPPLSDRWSVFTDEQGPTTSRFRENDHTSSLSSKRAAEDDEDPLATYRYCNRWGKHGGPSVFWRSDFDDFFPFASRFMHTFLPPFGDGGFEDNATWPGAFLVFSPYSPINLERRPGRPYPGDHGGGVFSSLMSSLRLGSESDKEFEPKEDGHEPRWHEAFEDLMRLENGKSMLERDDSVGAVTKKESGMDWLKGMVQRGSLGDGWKWHQDGGTPEGYFMLERAKSSSSPSSSPAQETHKEGEVVMTEQDMYECFLDDLQRREHEFSKLFDESLTLRFLLGDPQRKQELLERQRDLLPPQDVNNGTSLNSSASASDNNTQQSPPLHVAVSPYRREWIEPDDTPPDVVSTNTKTLRYNMKDGSTHTKTIKTHVFVDGHEEIEESFDKTPAEKSQVLNGAGDAGQSGNSNANSNKKSSNTGWFWSR